jgi:hypothetical protein
MKKLVALMLVSLFVFGVLAQISEAGWVPGRLGLRYWDPRYEEPTFIATWNLPDKKRQIEQKMAQKLLQQ